jgi:glycosyltransferase A (GT-A) superfamily protein (DUF2064 family)
VTARGLVVAKAPVPGLAKTRLAADVGDHAAAQVAAAALLDTLAACREAFGAEACVLALAGELSDAVRGDEIAAALTGWGVVRQRGSTFAERLANAHLDLPPGEPAVQVGMDTPQVRAADLRRAAAALGDHDAVLGPAEDGGWWVLGLRDPRRANLLHDVAMSTPSTYDDTRAALVGAGLRVATTDVLRDVDDLAAAWAVAGLADGEFSRCWQAVAP